MKLYFVFDRIAGKGNPWGLVVNRAFENRSDTASFTRYANRKTRGRDVRVVHIEPQKWTPDAIAALQRRGLLPH
jgi:hypothetical protein